MKTLYIVRHGKSSWDYEGVHDFDRPLMERGINDAYKMAARLRDNSHSVEMIISSPAARALHTAVIFSRVLEIPEMNIELDEGLYASDTDEILDVLYSIDDEVNSVMIFGHNPGFTDFANYISGLSINKIPTSGVVMVEFNTKKWTEINKNIVVSNFFDYPGND